jgi:hypothetical protein
MKKIAALAAAALLAGCTINTGADTGTDTNLSNDSVTELVRVAWDQQTTDDQDTLCLLWGASPDAVIEILQKSDDLASAAADLDVSRAQVEEAFTTVLDQEC